METQKQLWEEIKRIKTIKHTHKITELINKNKETIIGNTQILDTQTEYILHTFNNTFDNEHSRNIISRLESTNSETEQTDIIKNIETKRSNSKLQSFLHNRNNIT